MTTRPRSRVANPVLVTSPPRRAIAVPRGSEVTCKYTNLLGSNSGRWWHVPQHVQDIGTNDLLIDSKRGFFGKGDMQTEFEQASFALQPGQVRFPLISSLLKHVLTVESFSRCRKFSTISVQALLSRLSLTLVQPNNRDTIGTSHYREVSITISHPPPQHPVAPAAAFARSSRMQRLVVARGVPRSIGFIVR